MFYWATVRKSIRDLSVLMLPVSISDGYMIEIQKTDWQ